MCPIGWIWEPRCNWKKNLAGNWAKNPAKFRPNNPCKNTYVKGVPVLGVLGELRRILSWLFGQIFGHIFSIEFVPWQPISNMHIKMEEDAHLPARTCLHDVKIGLPRLVYWQWNHELYRVGHHLVNYFLFLYKTKQTKNAGPCGDGLPSST